MIGAGTGLICSGDVCDLALYNLVERCFVLLVTTRRAYEIKAYFRFRDDLFIAIGGTASSRREFFHEVQRRSQFFKLEVESINSTKATMLDVTVFKGNGWQESECLDYVFYEKPTSIWTPLAPDSNHPLHVHASWTHAQLGRFSKRCSSTADAGRARVQMINRFKAVGIELATKPARKPKFHPTVIAWLPLPYKFVWRNLQAQNTGGVSNIPQMRICWKNGDKHIFRRARSTYNKDGTGGTCDDDNFVACTNFAFSAETVHQKGGT